MLWSQLPVQIYFLNVPRQTFYITLTLKVVLNENICGCQLCCLMENDAGDLGGDALRAHHKLLAHSREGVVELVLDHHAGPELVGISQVDIQGSLVSWTGLTDYNVAFNRRQSTSPLPPSTSLREESYHKEGEIFPRLLSLIFFLPSSSHQITH